MHNKNPPVTERLEQDKAQDQITVRPYREPGLSDNNRSIGSIQKALHYCLHIYGSQVSGDSRRGSAHTDGTDDPAAFCLIWGLGRSGRRTTTAHQVHNTDRHQWKMIVWSMSAGQFLILCTHTSVTVTTKWYYLKKDQMVLKVNSCRADNWI